jgi:hypothetical protein
MTQQIMLDHAEFVEAWHLATTINKYLSIYLAFSNFHTPCGE